MLDNILLKYFRNLSCTYLEGSKNVDAAFHILMTLKHGYLRDQSDCLRLFIRMISHQFFSFVRFQSFISFFKMTPASFLFFIIFKHEIYRKTVGVSGTQTRIVGVEGEHTDHLTTITAPSFISLML